jgi:hypothetical protein
MIDLDFDFADTDMPEDASPPTTDVQYPCEVCGKEAGPYGGRGRKPRFCIEHKKGSKNVGSRKVTGSSAALAAQATGVLSQLNGIIAVGLMAIGFNDTASAIARGDDAFSERAHAALLTDPDLCKFILKGGVKSAKVTLGLAYVGLGIGVVPVAMAELAERRAEVAARKAREE